MYLKRCIRSSSSLAALVCLWCSLAYAQLPAPSRCLVLDNALIQTASNPKIYLVKGGKRYWVSNYDWILKHGYNPGSVVLLNPSEVAGIPSGYDLAADSPVPGQISSLENRLVSSTEEGRVYLIAGGERHWIVDPRWLAEHRPVAEALVPVSRSELQAIPIGSDITYISSKDMAILGSLTVLLFAFFVVASGKSSIRPSTKWIIAKARSWRGRILLFTGFLVLIIFRQQSLVFHPRFWAEDAHIFFQYGSYHSILKTLTFLYPASGYFNLMANIGGVLSSFAAAHFGLQYAPAATTVIALVLHVLPVGLVLFGKSRMFDSPWKAVAGCLIILFAPTATDEIWLNVINSMSYLGLFALLLVFEDTSSWSPWLKWTVRGCLAVCGMSGVYSVVLLPLFIACAYIYKQRETKIQCGILGVCLLFQSGLVVYSKIAGGGLPTRGLAVRLDSAMVNVLFGHVAIPSLGVTVTQNLIGVLGLTDAWMSATTTSVIHPFSAEMRVAGWVSFFALAALIWCLRGSRLSDLQNLVIAAFLILATLTSLAAVYAVPQGRYAFLPGLAFLLLLLLKSERGHAPAVRYLCMAVLAFGLANGILNYRRPLFSGPPWSGEVQAWRANHAYELRIWPSWIPVRIKYDPPKRTSG
jgi:hypothetical protein